jgi:four helix bundle protein
MKENIIQDKSYTFAIRIVKLYKYLCEIKKEYVLSKQILRSGTSIGANVEEAIGGQSKNDFISKLSIAYKEARETHYWLRILKDTDFIDEIQFKSLEQDINEILKILTSIQKSVKKVANNY